VCVCAQYCVVVCLTQEYSLFHRALLQKRPMFCLPHTKTFQPTYSENRKTDTHSENRKTDTHSENRKTDTHSENRITHTQADTLINKQTNIQILFVRTILYCCSPHTNTTVCTLQQYCAHTTTILCTHHNDIVVPRTQTQQCAHYNNIVHTPQYFALMCAIHQYCNNTSTNVRNTSIL